MLFRSLPVVWRRRVSADGLVTVETNRYSVPAQHIGHEVDVLPGPDQTVRIYREGQLLAVHPRRSGRDALVVDLAHAHALAAITGVRHHAWQATPLPDVEVRDLAIYELVSQPRGEG